MGKTKIEWAEKVWNPVTGCTKISAGCQHCYAERMVHRLQAMGQKRYENGFKVTCHPEALEEPLRWKKPIMIFVCSMADLFHDDVPFSFQMSVFDVIRKCPQHTFLVLTKRPWNMQTFVRAMDGPHFDGTNEIPPNVWLGVTAENQEQADKRIPILLQTPAAKRFVSVEPMLEAVDLMYPKTIWPDGPQYCCSGRDCGCYGMPIDPPLIFDSGNKIDWVICGGESGPAARPMHPDWVRSLRDQCQAANVPFMFKQWGEWCDIDQMAGVFPFIPNSTKEKLIGIKESISGCEYEVPTYRVSKKKAGRLLDGQLWDQYPDRK